HRGEPPERNQSVRAAGRESQDNVIRPLSDHARAGDHLERHRVDPARQPDRREGHPQVISKISRRVQPYWLHAYLLVSAPIRLFAAQTPLVKRHGRRVAYAVLAGAGTWAVLGLTALPIVTGRFDLQGALCLPVFAYFLLRSPRWPLFAAIFIIVSELEIFGTSFGDWAWMPVAPWTHIPSGNPPSVIAGGYCVIDASVLAVLWVYREGLKTIMA